MSPNPPSPSKVDVSVIQQDDRPRLTEEEKKQNHIASGMPAPPPVSQRRRHVFSMTRPRKFRDATKKAKVSSPEQKRRQAIREGFDRLTELVPGLEGQARSEGMVLKRTVEYMREKVAQRQALVERLEKAGVEVDHKFMR